MKFVDEATIKVVAGNGGNGCLSFRRENLFLKEDPTEVMVAVSSFKQSWN